MRLCSDEIDRLSSAEGGTTDSAEKGEDEIDIAIAFEAEATYYSSIYEPNAVLLRSTALMTP